jgi:hypothetical protein
VKLAGLLAEGGVQGVVLESQGQRREVMARVTDLPRLVSELGESRVVAGGVTYSVDNEGIRRVG